MAVRPTRLAAVLAAFAVALALVGHTTGSGWVIVIVAGVGGLLIVGTVAPGVVLARTSVDVTGPRDAVAGRPAALHVSVTAPGPVLVRAGGPDGEKVAVHRSGEGAVEIVLWARGLVEDVDIEIESGGPLGLARWRRRRRLALPWPVEVAPVPRDVDLPVGGGGGGSGGSHLVSRTGGETVRTVREHVPGDPLRLVHWPATARRGQLVVKELEEPAAPALAVVVDLRGDPDAAEEAASRAAGLALAGLRAGLPVTMLTAEAGGGRVGAVTTALEVGRRLARAVAAAPPEGPVAGTQVVRVAGGRP